MNKLLILAVLVVFIQSGIASQDYHILNTFKLQDVCYTQGYIYRSDLNQIVESCGLKGKSRIITYALDEGSLTASKAVTRVINDKNVFAEGLTYLNGKYYQLTWQNNIMYTYDENFKLINTSILPKEMESSGWGLTNDGTYLYATSGSSYLFVIDPSDYSLKQMINVLDNKGRPVIRLNECEIVDSSIYCNIYQSTKIYKINYKTGEVEHIYYMSELLGLALQESSFRQKNGDNRYLLDEYSYTNYVLNGIAYNKDKQTFYLTGKDWPLAFEVELAN